ncbi:invasion associated locus B family protein [Dichotomicrobium thermohalophilum]|nr:invasion associated locus B family protein [Dichotomicrobium thermohalophilum]
MNKICRSAFALCGLVAGAALAGSLLISSHAAAQEEQKQKSQAAWVKLCEKAPSLQEEGKELDVCLTHHERIDGNTGRVLVSAAIRQVEGKDTRSLMVMVPLGMALPAGVQAKVDDNEPIKLKYTLCHVGGCTAETEATDEIIEQFRQGEKLVVAAMNLSGKPIGFPVPLSGFTKAYAGDPVDNEKYRAARQQLMQTIRKRQMAMMKKAQEEQQNKQEGEGQ